jgi:hypothetical protein
MLLGIGGTHHIFVSEGRYVTQEDIDTYGSIEERQFMISNKGWLGKEWLAKWVELRGVEISYSTTALVALGPYEGSPKLSFTHGSLRPTYSHITPYPDKINEIGYSLLSKALTPPTAKPHPPFPYSGLPKGKRNTPI